MTILEMRKDDIKTCLEAYDMEVQGQLRDVTALNVDTRSKTHFFSSGIDEVDNFTPEGYVEYVGAQMMVPQADGRIQGRITKRAKDEKMEIPSGGDTTIQ
jgi:hypothetical protein